MKKLFLLLSIFGIALGCDPKDPDDDPNKKPEKVFMEVSAETVYFLEQSSSQSIKFTCNTTWTVKSSNDEWCKVSVGGGQAGDNMAVTISVTANDATPESYEDRNAIVTFTAGESVATLSVNQKKKGALIVTKDKFDNIPFTGGTIPIEVKSNVNVDFVPNVPWIRPAAKGRGLSTTTREFIIEPSTSNEVREGRIYVNERAGSLADTVYVFQAERGTLVLVSRYTCVTDLKSQFNVDLKTNIEYTVTPIDSWLHHVEARASRTDRITLSADQNTESLGRWGSAVFKDKNSPLADTLYVYQTFSNALIISPMVDSVSAAGGEITVITKESGYKVAVDEEYAEWIKPLSTDGNVHKFSIPKNTTENERDGLIKVTGGGKEDVITISQQQKDVISAKVRHFNVSANADKIDVSILSNVSIDYSMPSWITMVTGKGATTTSVRFNIAANSSRDFRKGEIVAKNSKTGVSDTIRVYQGFGESALYLYVPAFGELDKITEDIHEQREKALSVKVAGYLNNADFMTLNTMFAVLGELDMEDAKCYGDLIPDNAFNFGSGSGWLGKSSLTKVILPKSLKEIGLQAFLRTGLRTMPTLPAGFERIDSLAFYECMSMKGEVKFPSGMTEIDFGAFTRCEQLSGSLTLPSTITILGAEAFIGCKGFSGNITIPANIKRIPTSVFADCEGFNGSINLPSEATVIETSAFKNCKLVTNRLVLPKTLKSIETDAFSGCAKLNGTLIIPEKIQAIGSAVFQDCRSLTALELPNGLKSIDSTAFRGCAQINSVVTNIIVPFKADNVFRTIASNSTLTIPKGTKLRYENVSGWGEPAFTTIKETGTGNDHIVIKGDRVVSSKKGAVCPVDLFASGGWSMVSKPDWVKLSKTSGSTDSKIEITIDQMSQNAQRNGDIVFKLNDSDTDFTVPVLQAAIEHGDGDYRTVQTATHGRGIDVIIMGDGYNIEDVISGKYDRDMDRAAKAYFIAEPYKSYREYFTMKIVYAFSNESGVSDVNNVVDTKFSTKFMDTEKSNNTLMDVNETSPVTYASKALGGSTEMAGKPIIVVANSPRYGGTALMYQNGASIAVCPVSDRPSPLDFEAVVIHESCGHGLALLTEEYYASGTTISDDNKELVKQMQALGWFNNVSLTNNSAQVAWKELIGRPKYEGVGVFEGGHQAAQGIWRSEQNSCMRSMGRHFNAWSRLLIVKRIKALAGETYSLEDFLQNDVDDSKSVKSRGVEVPVNPSMMTRSRVIKGAPKVHRTLR